MELTELQKTIINAPEPKIAVQACAAAAKAQPNYTIIPTPEGYKKLGAIKVGDYVFDRYGKPTRVLGVYPQGQKQIYKITFQDGTIAECADEHLWSYDNGHGGLTTHTTEEIIKIGWQSKDNRGHYRYKIKIPNLINPVEYITKEYKIHPYVIGCFLGDGCCTEKYLTMSSADKEVIDEICSLTGFQSYRRSQYNYSWDFYNNGNKIKTQNFFQEYSKEMIGYSYEKVIPEEYLFGDVEQRLELLRGLMDTDGYIGNGRNSPKFSTTSPGLRDSFLNLVRSLGFYATVSVCPQKDNHREKYEISFFTGKNNVHQIVKLSRKKKIALTFITEQKQHINHKYKSIYNIEKTDKFTEMTCIYVDNQEHLYLTNDYIVTHNTTTLTEKVRQLLRDGTPPTSIAVITFTRMAAAELVERLGDDYKDGLFVGTIHSLGARFLAINGLGGRIKQIAEDEDFDKIFELCKDLSIKKSYDWVLVDEMQDTGEKEMEFIFDLIDPEHYFVVFDTRQSIYSFKGARPDLLMKYLRGNAKFYPLSQNFRNSRNILSYAQRIISRTGNYDDSECMYGLGGEIYEIEYSIDTLVNHIKNNPPYKEWAILTRTNADVTKISNDLARFGIPTQTFKQGDLTKSQLEKMMKEDKVKVLTVHSAKGLAWDHVAVYDLRWWNDEEVRINYVAATRARKSLLWMNVPRKRKKPKTYDW